MLCFGLRLKVQVENLGSFYGVPESRDGQKSYIQSKVPERQIWNQAL